MHKLLASTYKELLLLLRDSGGLAILFIMPLVLVVTITLIQDSTFKAFKDASVPILWVDNDRGSISDRLREQLSESQQLSLVTETSESAARDLVGQGKYQLAVVLPQGLSRDLEQKVNHNVDQMLVRFGLDEPDSLPPTAFTPKEIKLYFDPAANQNFKRALKNGIGQIISGIEAQSIYTSFQKQLTDDPDEVVFDRDNLITFKEMGALDEEVEPTPNSTQHNVPAWTLFAIFFIIVPLSINIVKEKSQGTFVRLRTQPVGYATVLLGKTLVYLCVCIIQFALMLLIGVFLFPQLGLPALDISGRLTLLFVVTIFAGLAAIGLGLLLGTLANTQEQSAPFGATFVVILAALGGVWVPVFAMPRFMQYISNISPMNWGLNAYYDVFLRNTGILQILPEICLLFLFFLITTAMAVLVNKKKYEV